MASKTAKDKRKKIEEEAKAALAPQAATKLPTETEAKQTDTVLSPETKTPNMATEPPLEQSAENEVVEKPLAGKALVVYNGYINIRRVPFMTDDAICGQVRRGQVLNVVASVEMHGIKFYRLAGGEYIKADPKLVEFTKV